MKYMIAFFAALLTAAPAAAQPSGGGNSHPGMHAPSMHSPLVHSPAMRPSASHAMHPMMHAPAMHHVSYHRTNMHHVVHHAMSHHHHAVVRHHAVHHTIRATSHTTVRRAPAAAVAKLRRNVVARHRFHAGAYRAPPGWHYRRWAFGERLPSIYFAQAFWITDFLAFDLFPPPDGYVWVRYGPDALLIDEYTGEIIQVDYDVFY